MKPSYEPGDFEKKRYEFWEKNGYFEAKDSCAPGQNAFCIMIPPPNVTGVLHIGHALTNTLQDILVRWRRMKGDNTLWLPGMDHAGIATQIQVEKAIAKEGTTRHKMGREAFIQRVWKWKENHGSTITSQLKRMGSSLDWRRERFTMDEGLSRAVREVFVRLYEEGLIYRGERIINWCPRCQTALSDLEVVPTDRKSKLWEIAYPVEGTTDRLVIATTRPETLLGDTAVAIHPEDERYKHLHGKFCELPLTGRKIPIIADPYVDREFGTGALKITPAHDFNDYEIGKKHNLPFVSVMGKDGKITAEGGAYAGMKFEAAREKILQDLESRGLLLKTQDYANKIGLCQRCEHVSEPIISKQWFVKIEPLAKPAIEAVEDGRIQFTPKHWEKTYFEWMRNIRDWCISRQLWWGHQIPAWYCSKCNEVTVSREIPKKCSKCGTGPDALKQDEDVLDTWFSSALWPFSTLGWPEQTQALKTFYPTAILETGLDIIFFWVARMIMMGMHFMGDVPFRKVYIHALVRDEKGDKMSKSRGNVMDPLEIIDRLGADPLRFTLSSMAGQGRNIKISEDRIDGYKAFCNKLWNAVKFFHLQMEGTSGEMPAPAGGVERWLRENHTNLHPMNQWILSRLQSACSATAAGLENFELDLASKALYEFTWYEFCDWYIEFSKLPLRQGGELRTQALITLHYVLDRLLRLLHPFIPFVTEELWLTLPWKEMKAGTDTLMLQVYPEMDREFQALTAEKTIQTLKQIIDAIRNFRGENNISPKVDFPVFFQTSAHAMDAFIRLHQEEICSLSRITSLTKTDNTSTGKDKTAVIPLPQISVELRISLEGLVNFDEEKKRIKKEIEKIDDDLAFVRNKLSQETFISRAPKELVEKERQKEQNLNSRKAELALALQRISG